MNSHNFVDFTLKAGTTFYLLKASWRYCLPILVKFNCFQFELQYHNVHIFITVSTWEVGPIFPVAFRGMVQLVVHDISPTSGAAVAFYWANRCCPTFLTKKGKVSESIMRVAWFKHSGELSTPTRVFPKLSTTQKLTDLAIYFFPFFPCVKFVIVTYKFCGICCSNFLLIICIKRVDKSRYEKENKTWTETQKFRICQIRQHCVIREQLDYLAQDS